MTSRELVTQSQKWIVDSREPSSIKKLLKRYKIPFEVDELPVGDLAYGNIIIERKTIHDLANSVINGRIWGQLRNLEAIVVDGKPILLVELRGKEYWKYLTYLSSISAYCAKRGIYLIVVHSRKALANTLKQFMNGKTRSISLKKRWKGHPPQLVILAQFPNIGIKKAKELLNVYHNLRGVFSAEEEQLSKILGKVTARKFMETLLENPYDKSDNDSNEDDDVEEGGDTDGDTSSE